MPTVLTLLAEEYARPVTVEDAKEYLEKHVPMWMWITITRNALHGAFRGPVSLSVVVAERVKWTASIEGESVIEGYRDFTSLHELIETLHDLIEQYRPRTLSDLIASLRTP